MCVQHYVWWTANQLQHTAYLNPKHSYYEKTFDSADGAHALANANNFRVPRKIV